MNRPFVSVVIPTYNRAHCIKEAIDSVLNQTFQDFEIIIVDDGSTDNTGTILEGYGKQIQYIKQENQGVSISRNNGIKISRGEWIGFLDSDDVWENEKLKFQTEDIKKNLNIAVHCVDVVIESNEKAWSLFELRDMVQEYKNRPLRERPLLDVLNTQFFIQGCLIKKEFLNLAGHFNASFTTSEDLDLLSRLALTGMFYVNFFKGAKIRRKQSSETPLSDNWRLNRKRYLLNWLQIFQNLLDNPSINRTEYLEIQRRLGGVRCELFDEYKKKKEWRKAFHALYRSMVDDPGIRSVIRAGVHFVGAAQTYARLKTKSRAQTSFRRSEVDTNSGLKG